jgi:hypothetical protein
LIAAEAPPERKVLAVKMVTSTCYLLDKTTDHGWLQTFGWLFGIEEQELGSATA